MRFEAEKNQVVCECGCSLEITASMAGQVLGSIKTIVRANALRKNASKPRPGNRLRKGLLELSNARLLKLLESVAEEKKNYVKKKRGRPKLKK